MVMLNQLKGVVSGPGATNHYRDCGCERWRSHLGRSGGELDWEGCFQEQTLWDYHATTATARRQPIFPVSTVVHIATKQVDQASRRPTKDVSAGNRSFIHQKRTYRHQPTLKWYANQENLKHCPLKKPNCCGEYSWSSRRIKWICRTLSNLR